MVCSWCACVRARTCKSPFLTAQATILHQTSCIMATGECTIHCARPAACKGSVQRGCCHSHSPCSRTLRPSCTAQSAGSSQDQSLKRSSFFMTALKNVPAGAVCVVHQRTVIQPHEHASCRCQLIQIYYESTTRTCSGPAFAPQGIHFASHFLEHPMLTVNNKITIYLFNISR